MPTLDWIGKNKVVNHHLDVPYCVLNREYSYDEFGQHKNDNGSKNMIIHGDNLLALKSLLPQYEGRIKCIYIDPPYNTGNEGWIYNDNVNDPRIKNWLGEVVGKEGEDLSRHDKWLCMMYPRLKLLQKLLSNDGVIFISIDDIEYANLKLICDEIFGATCFVSNISWQRTYSTRNDSKGIVNEVEHLIVYSKNSGWMPNKLPRTDKMNARFKNPDNDITPWTSSDAFAPDAVMHQGMVYAIQHPFTGKMIYPTNGRHWRYQQDEMLRQMSEWCPYELRNLHDEKERAKCCGIPVDEVRPDVYGIVLKNSLEESYLKACEIYKRGRWPSVEMLDNLNPSFIMELTATPRASSNIISYVDARKLKSENMVKLPVVVFNRSSRQAVIQDAIQLRGNIEKQAINEYRAGGEYIRPIVLFQAQPKINSASETFDKIKELLIEMGIPEEQIAIKTSNVDDIGMIDLMSPESKIRYIITVNALKEGWDCPFAYILASLANKTSKVDVEQIVGRILRQPYTKLHKATLLNTSYVLTSSNDFHATLESIVVGLNKSGYSRKDYRIGDENAEQDKVSEEKVVLNDEEEMIPGLLLKNADDKKEQKDDFADIDPAEMSSFLVNSEDDKDDSVETETPELVSMISAATTQIESYNEEIKNASNNGFVGGELGEMLKQNGIQPQYQQEIANLKIPQFYIQSEPDLFGDCYELLEAENLSEGFSLNGQDAQIDFSLASG